MLTFKKMVGRLAQIAPMTSGPSYERGESHAQPGNTEG